MQRLSKATDDMANLVWVEVVVAGQCEGGEVEATGCNGAHLRNLD